MSALDQTMQGFQTGLGVAEHLRNNRQKKIAAKNQAKYNQQMQNALGGAMPTMTPPIVPPNSSQSAPNPLSAPTQAPTAPQMPPQQQNALGGPNYAQAAQLAASQGDYKRAESLQKMAGVRQTNQAAMSKTQADAQKAGLETMYRMGQQVMQDPSLLEPAKAQLIKMGMDQQTVAGITMQTLPQTMKLLEAQLGGNTQTLKDKETVYNPLTGKAVFENRGPQTVSDGAALVGADGSELYNNQKDVNPTADMQNFEEAKANGYTGTFFDYQKEIKAAGKSTTSVTVGKGENSYDIETGKQYSKRNISIQSSAQGARAKLSRLQEMRKALDNDAVYTGAGGESVQKLKRVALAFGLDVDKEGIADADIVNALGNQLALSMRSTSDGEGMPGQLSDRDIQFLTSSVPNLQKTREGNLKLIDYAMKVEQRKIDVEKWRQEYVQMNGGRLDEGFSIYLRNKVEEQGSLFEGAQVASGGAENTDIGFTRRPDGALRYDF